jgi:hypothetical protein
VPGTDAPPNRESTQTASDEQRVDPATFPFGSMVGAPGFEPGTSCAQVRKAMIAISRRNCISCSVYAIAILFANSSCKCRSMRKIGAYLSSYVTNHVTKSRIDSSRRCDAGVAGLPFPGPSSSFLRSSARPSRVFGVRCDSSLMDIRWPANACGSSRADFLITLGKGRRGPTQILTCSREAC